MELNLEELMNGHRNEPEPEEALGSGCLEPENGAVSIPEGENHYLHNPEEGLKLCAGLIKRSSGNEPHHKLLKQFNRLVDEDFLALASTDKNDTSTRTYARLQSFKKRLVELANFPVLEQCYTVAVGGAFSAGKSRFLNSVLGCPSLLPTDTTPTTSIPTFISQGSRNRITALNSFQEQKEIDQEALGAICHAFNDRFGVTFSHLLQLISIERESLKYPALAFLDTPGYSKSDNINDRSENTDEKIAREQLASADYLIWLVDIQNGTIPKPDIDFISSLELEQPILVIFNKADKMPEAQVRQILATARQDLERAELACHDVIGYSSRTSKEISDTGNVLASMLDTINSSQRGTTALWQLDQIMNQHISDYQTEQQTLKLTLKTVNELLFDDDLSEDRKCHLVALQQKTKSQADTLFGNEKQAREIHNTLQDTLTELCELLELSISQCPSRIEIQSRVQKLSGSLEGTCFTFSALLDGDTNKLAPHSNLSKLPGVIERLGPLGAYVQCDQGLEVIILKPQLRQILGETSLTDTIQPGLPVTIQVSGNKKCLVHLDITA